MIIYYTLNMLFPKIIILHKEFKFEIAIINIIIIDYKKNKKNYRLIVNHMFIFII